MKMTTSITDAISCSFRSLKTDFLYTYFTSELLTQTTFIKQSYTERLWESPKNPQSWGARFTQWQVVPKGLDDHRKGDQPDTTLVTLNKVSKNIFLPCFPFQSQKFLKLTKPVSYTFIFKNEIPPFCDKLCTLQTLHSGAYKLLE